MHHVIFFDDDHWQSLLPLTFTKPCAEIRVGLRTISQKWLDIYPGSFAYVCRDYLNDKYPMQIDKVNFIINGRLLPNRPTIDLISQLEMNEAYIYNDTILAARLDEAHINSLGSNTDDAPFKAIDISSIAKDYVQFIERPHHIFSSNKEQLAYDISSLRKSKRSLQIATNNTVFNAEHIFLEEGAQVECSILDARSGPIYISKNAKVMANASIQGPFGLGVSSTVKMGAKIYPGVSTGPHCKIGGELGNSILQGYSNKGHDGYLGDSVLGEWCNLGADTNNSNLKNNYAEVRSWNYTSGKFDSTGLQFCGLIMGDHSKSAINTMFNTGTVVGLAANVFGHGFPKNFIPSFSWGGYSKISTFSYEKALEMMERMMARRGVALEQNDINIMQHVFNETAKHRTWEKS